MARAVSDAKHADAIDPFKIAVAAVRRAFGDERNAVARLHEADEALRRLNEAFAELKAKRERLAARAIQTGEVSDEGVTVEFKLKEMPKIIKSAMEARDACRLDLEASTKKTELANSALAALECNIERKVVAQ